ncbi:PASTA domain-containing protein [Streptomyces sp. NPDC000229]|uniref:PASTA domain-containing protein n=1 Tax=Streptomyces sp. NPDC000229 TaxID=3154247 RepID=UPI00332544F3
MAWNTQPPQQPKQPQWAEPPGAGPGDGPRWARKRIVIPAALVLFLVGVGIGSSGSGDTKVTAGSRPAPTVTRTVTAAPVAPQPKAAVSQDAAKPAPAVEEPSEKVTVPDFVGMDLQAAQDAAQAEGLYVLTSHDSTGAGRMQVLDRNWTVCTQNHEPGTVIATDSELDFGAVKLTESCP